MDHPPLPTEIVVLPGTDVEAAWDRFHVFEALHHSMAICNPMSSGDLDQVIDRIAPGDGDHVLDVACGHGELLLRVAAATDVTAVGVDLSPWVLLRAHHQAGRRPLEGTIEWWLGDGADIPAEPRWDVATCLGASWVYHGFAGTVRALARRVRPGGRIAVGDLRLREDAAPEAVEALVGVPLDRDRQRAALDEAGFEAAVEIVIPYGSIIDYQDRITVATESYAADHEGDPEMDFRAFAAEGRADFERDLEVLTWSIWTARKPG